MKFGSTNDTVRASLSLLFAVAFFACTDQDLRFSPGTDASVLNVQDAESPREISFDAGTIDASAKEINASTAKKLEVYFSPNGGCTNDIVAFIQSAKTGILVQAYTFTSQPILAALLSASKRIPVRVILDKSDVGTPVVQTLLGGQISTWIDAKHVIAHNKVVIVDGKYVETGSFNYTYEAEHGNAENCLFVRDTVIAGEYVANWNIHLAHSTPAVLPTPAPPAP